MRPSPFVILSLVSLLGACASSSSPAPAPEATEAPKEAASPGVGDPAMEVADSETPAAVPSLPTPFTVAQIRDAFPLGTHLVMSLEPSKGKPMRSDWLVVRSTDERVTIRYTTFAADGVTVLDGPTTSSDTWATLEAHARFPEAETTRAQGTVPSPTGPRPGWIYSRTERKDGAAVVSTYRFADDLPGPPTEMVATKNGAPSLTMRMLVRDQQPVPAGFAPPPDP